jgi:fructose-1,6-bisphosphatase/inositol monophosphatase family enzyme
MNLNELCETAKKAAICAGQIIKEAQGTNVQVEAKEGGENLASQVVTEVDHKAQEAILKILTPTLKSHQLGLLTEESPDDNSRFNHSHFWCIDPLDGTLAFSRNQDGYSTSIALVSKEGQAIIGVVYNPRTETLYHAIRNHGAFKNGEVFKISKWAQELTLLYDASFLKREDYPDEMKKLQELAHKHGLKGVRKFHLGGAVMNGISTIEYAPAVYYKHPKLALGGGSIWDFAASSIIQKEAGGFNSDFHGEPLMLNASESTFMNKKGVRFASSCELIERA